MHKRDAIAHYDDKNPLWYHCGVMADTLPASKGKDSCSTYAACKDTFVQSAGFTTMRCFTEDGYTSNYVKQIYTHHPSGGKPICVYNQTRYPYHESPIYH